jgi:hypothetical protein
LKKVLFITWTTLLWVNQTSAQKNFCHLIYELSTTDANTLGTFAPYIDEPCELSPFYLVSSMLNKYEGVRECECDFSPGKTFPEAPGKKYNVCAATITLTTFDTQSSDGKSQLWNQSPNKDNILQMFDRTVKYLHEGCFSSQQISKVFADDETRDNPSRIVYLYAPGYTTNLPNDKKEYYNFFLDRPHIDVRLQQDIFRPLCKLQVVLVWATEAK